MSCVSWPVGQCTSCLSSCGTTWPYATSPAPRLLLSCRFGTWLLWWAAVWPPASPHWCRGQRGLSLHSSHLPLTPRPSSTVPVTWMNSQPLKSNQHFYKEQNGTCVFGHLWNYPWGPIQQVPEEWSYCREMSAAASWRALDGNLAYESFRRKTLNERVKA